MRRFLASALIVLPLAAGSSRAAEKIRVLFVGGDWKAQLPNYRGSTPLRGFFVRQEVEKAARGQFDFTLWTSYRFLRYGDAESLGRFDVIVAGDIMGQSVMPRLVRGLTAFVANGGGFVYCDNHKAFSFQTKQRSFDPVLPVEVRPFRPYDPGLSQPVCTETPCRIKPAVVQHPIMTGLDWSGAPPLRSGGRRGPHYGKVKAGATVLATSPGGKPLWVVWRRGKGRAAWLGGVFSNDELSTDFAKWPQFGRFYAQMLRWLAGEAARPHVRFEPASASGTLTVDLAKALPAVSARHFGIHGQEYAGSSAAMKGADLALYRQLRLHGTFARTGAASNGIKKVPGGKRFDFLDDGTDITTFDWSKYDFKEMDLVAADCDRIGAEPIWLYWCPWKRIAGQPYLDAKRYTKYFAAAIEHADGRPGSPGYRGRVKYFEIMNEPDLSPADEALGKYADLFNYAARTLRKRHPGVKFGCGGFYEWTYFQRLIDRCGKNIDWFSRHPYGKTGESLFYLQDQFLAYARSKGHKDLKFIITEWDFWIYGAPAFDYAMMRWKPLLDRADTCLGTLHYRWREYQEGGYVFGIHGEFDRKYGQLPPRWPNPGRCKPIVYRYNAFWIMRDCRGKQYAVGLDSPELGHSESPRAYGVATCTGKQFNIVIHYGYAYQSAATAKVYDKLKLRVRSAIPPAVKGRTLVISRADHRKIREGPPRTIAGDTLALEIELPSQSAVSLTVK